MLESDPQLELSLQKYLMESILKQVCSSSMRWLWVSGALDSWEDQEHRSWYSVTLK